MSDYHTVKPSASSIAQNYQTADQSESRETTTAALPIHSTDITINAVNISMYNIVYIDIHVIHNKVRGNLSMAQV